MQHQTEKNAIPESPCADLTASDLANKQRFSRLTILWLIAHVTVAVILKQLDTLPAAATSVIGVIPVGIGIVVLLAYYRFIRNADELTRIIHLEGLALGFCVGLLFSLSYPLLEYAGWPELISNAPAVVMVLGLGVGHCIARRKYL